MIRKSANFVNFGAINFVNFGAMLNNMELLFVTCSDCGKVRQQNEDYAGHTRNEDINGDLFCVADGMGGHGSGDLASRTVVDSLLHEFSTLTNYRPNSFEITTNNLFAKAQLTLKSIKQKNNIKSIIGTTLSALIFLPGTLIYANIGDTRIYCFDGDSLIQKSHDHTFVNDLVTKKYITPEQALVHPQKNVLTLAITGDETPIEAFIQVEPLNNHLIYLICSDGLYNMVDEKFICTVLKQSSIFQAQEYLLKQAYANGANDNLTFQIITPFDDGITVS
jgi:serine/threonine protein phosphatase PrpC